MPSTPPARIIRSAATSQGFNSTPRNIVAVAGANQTQSGVGLAAATLKVATLVLGVSILLVWAAAAGAAVVAVSGDTALQSTLLQHAGSLNWLTVS